MDLTLNFEQLQKKLKKVLNPSRFRFIVISYPKTKMAGGIREHISTAYPKSLVTDLQLKDKSYQDISSELYKNSEGFVYIDDFEELPNSSELYSSFSQRRDKIVSHNINLIRFVSLCKKEEIFTKATRVVPDSWELEKVKEFSKKAIDIFEGLDYDSPHLIPVKII